MDASRPEIATEAADDHRELMVHLWYPAAKPGRTPAPYLPGRERLASSAAAGSLQNLFGPAWSRIVSGELRTHSFERAPTASGTKLPVLIFSPGGGMPIAAYTTQMEELASHGYVLAAIEHTYDSPAVMFPDGRIVTADGAWDRMRRESKDPEMFEKNVTEIHAADVRFVVGKLHELESDRKSQFYARLDLARIGVFGHSRGGRTAARACQLDERIKACLNQDGNWSWRPFWLDYQGRSMRQPFMMLDHLDPDLPDDVYKKMNTTREAYAARREALRSEAREKLYGTVVGGSYHVTIKTPGISHNSFSDVRLLGRADGGAINAWPKDVQSRTPHAQIIGMVTAFTRAFFDKHLRGRRGGLAELAGVAGDEVEVRTYGVRVPPLHGRFAISPMDLPAGRAGSLQNPDRRVHRGDGKAQAIGRELHRVDLRSERDGKQRITGPGIPDADGLVVGSRREAGSVRREVQAIDEFRVPLERPEQAARWHLPKRDAAVPARSGEYLAGRVEGY